MSNNMQVSSQGTQLNLMLDALGLPDRLGDALGAQIDAARGDMGGYIRNALDFAGTLNTRDIENLFGAGLPQSQFVGNPTANFRHSRKLWGASYFQSFSINGSRELAKPDKASRRIGRRLERSLIRSTSFKLQVEQMVGGRVVVDGRMDMQVTVQRYEPRFSGVPYNKQVQSNPQMGGMYGALARMEQNVVNLAASLSDNSVNGSTSDRQIFSDPDTRKLAEGMGMKPPLAFEDMMMLMMMKYGRKKESEITGKMNELSGKSQLNNTANQPLNAGSLFGGLVGGPQQAAFANQAAQILSNPNSSTSLKNQQMAQLVNGFQQGGAQGSQGMFGDTQKTSDTLKQMQMQKMMEDLKKMYEMLSNIMKSMHSMQMTAIRNLR